MKKLVFVLSLLGANVFAQGETIKCEPPQDLADGGFRVEAFRENERSGNFQVTVTQIYGSGETFKRFEGTLYLKKFRNRHGKCVIQLVDAVVDPKNIISFVIGGEDFVQRLRGENQAAEIDNQRINILNKLACKETEQFSQIVAENCN